MSRMFFSPSASSPSGMSDRPEDFIEAMSARRISTSPSTFLSTTFSVFSLLMRPVYSSSFLVTML
jgi:hypothetical protein